CLEREKSEARDRGGGCTAVDVGLQVLSPLVVRREDRRLRSPCGCRRWKDSLRERSVRAASEPELGHGIDQPRRLLLQALRARRALLDERRVLLRRLVHLAHGLADLA